MGQMVTPSPTPPVNGQLRSTPPERGSTFPVHAPYHGHWGYDTPPLDESHMYGQELACLTRDQTALMSSQPDSNYTGFGPPLTAPHETLNSYSCLPPQLGDTRQQSKPATVRKTTNSKRYAFGGLAEHSDVEWSTQRSSRTRKKGATKTRKREKKVQFPDLAEPLSKWAKGRGLQPNDVHGFATRDIEKRIAQALKSGYIKRNLNVFFLYKRAFRDIAQAWMEIHHPQLARTQPPLVTLVGESWVKESEEFKKSYTIYSELEKEGLRRAFPHYKYKPGSKKEATTSKKDPRSSGDNGEKWDHNQDEHSTALDSNGQQFPGGSLLGLDLDHDAVPGLVARDSDATQMPVSYGREPLLMDPALEFGLTSGRPEVMHGSHEPRPTMESYGHPLLHPNHAGWQSSFGGRTTRSASPAFSHYSNPSLDSIPIDPSLPDTYSDYFPSRAASEEPQCIAPSQTFVSAAAPNVAYSRLPSTESLFGTTVDSADASIWPPALTVSRGASEEPWQDAPDSILSSVPTGNGPVHMAAAHESNDWHLESVEQDGQSQAFAWDLSDWTHDLGDGGLDSILG